MKAVCTVVVAWLFCLGVAQAQDWPTKTIHIVVPFNSGAGSDADARLYGDLLSKRLGQPVIVENRPGGSGIVAVQAVKAAPADGHTILLASNSPMSVNPVVMKEMPYDPFKDFRPICGLTVSPTGFVVRGDSPHKSIKDLVTAVKQRGQPISMGNYSVSYQLVATWLGTAAQIPIIHVTYRGGGQIVTDLLGGQIEVGVIPPSSVVSLIQDGKLRLLGVTDVKRYPQFPNVPTMIEQGFADFETYVWSSFFVRSETPDAIVEKLAVTMMELLVSEPAKAYRVQQGTEPLLLKTKAMRDFQLREYQRFKKAADAAGFQPQ